MERFHVLALLITKCWNILPKISHLCFFENKCKQHWMVLHNITIRKCCHHFYWCFGSAIKSSEITQLLFSGVFLLFDRGYLASNWCLDFFNCHNTGGRQFLFVNAHLSHSLFLKLNNIFRNWTIIGEYLTGICNYLQGNL